MWILSVSFKVLWIGSWDLTSWSNTMWQQFPTAAVNKLSGLKQQKFIILYFCRWEIQHGSHWAKIKVSARPSSFLEASGDKFFAFSIPWLSSLFKANHSRLNPSPITLLWHTLVPPSSTYKDPCDYIGPSQIIQNNLSVCLISKFNSICHFNSPLPYNLTYIQTSGNRTWSSFRIHYSTFHWCWANNFLPLVFAHVKLWNWSIWPLRSFPLLPVKTLKWQMLIGTIIFGLSLNLD